MHQMTTYGETEMYFHSFSTLAQMEMSGRLQLTAALAPVKHPPGHQTVKKKLACFHATKA